MAVRVTQSPFEVIVSANPNVRLTQNVIEAVVGVTTAEVLLSSLAVEVLLEDTGVISVGKEISCLWNDLMSSLPYEEEAYPAVDGVQGNEPSAVIIYGGKPKTYKWGK